MTLCVHPHLQFLPRLQGARGGEAAEGAGACVFTRPLEGVGPAGGVQHAEAPARWTEGLRVTRWNRRWEGSEDSLPPSPRYLVKGCEMPTALNCITLVLES